MPDARFRVLITASTFPATPGDGTPRFVYDLAESLTGDADVTVLAPASPGNPCRCTMGSVPVHRFTYFLPRKWQRLTPGRGLGMRENMRGSRLAKLQIPLFLLAETIATRTLARRLDVDVVNAHWLIPQGLAAALAFGRKQRGVSGRPQIVLHVHAGDVYLLNKIPFGRRIARFVVSRSDALFADGSHVRDSLDRLLGYPSGALLQPMGVRLADFAPTAGTSEAHDDGLPSFPDGYIASVGRFVEKKGTLYLIRALPQVLERYPGLGLVLIGAGPLEGELREEVRRLNLHARVHFAGQQSHDRVAACLRRARLAVVPSIIDSNGETEGMPTVVLEAMAAGAPVVASAVDGIPDVISHGRNGWLCREKDPQDLAGNIVSALNERNSRTLRRAVADTLVPYSWQSVATRYLGTFDKLRQPYLTNRISTE